MKLGLAAERKQGMAKQFRLGKTAKLGSVVILGCRPSVQDGLSALYCPVRVLRRQNTRHSSQRKDEAKRR
jgi:hypothetical protein